MKNIAVLLGDGVSNEIIDSAIKVLDKVSELYDIKLKYEYASIGGAAYEQTGTPLRKNDRNLFKIRCCFIRCCWRLEI